MKHSIEYHINRAEIYCYLGQLKRLRTPEKAIDYIDRDKYRYHLQNAWKKRLEYQ